METTFIKEICYFKHWLNTLETELYYLVGVASVLMYKAGLDFIVLPDRIVKWTGSPFCRPC